jgi:hypothetical protein
MSPDRKHERATPALLRPWPCSVPAQHTGIGHFRGSMAGLYNPLSTLRRHPRGCLRMTRVDVTRYIFIVADFHHLLLAGLPAHYVMVPFLR